MSSRGADQTGDEEGDTGGGADRGAARRAGLSPERVRDGALRLIDREGIDAFSMRRLAAELQVEAMSLYRHAPGRDAILDAVVDYIASGVEIDPDDPDWREQARRFALGLRAQIIAHPNVFSLVLARPLTTPLPRRGPAVLTTTDQLLAVLRRAGLDDAGTATTYRRIIAFVMGRVEMELRPGPLAPDDPEPALRLGLQYLPATRYPHLRALAEHIAEFDAEAEFRSDLEHLIASLG